MKTYDIELEITIGDTSFYKAVDYLYEAGLDDSTLTLRNSRLILTVSREASSVRSAITSIYADMDKTDFVIIGTEEKWK